MKRNNKTTLTLMILICAAIFIIANTARAATFTVNNAGDAGSGTCAATCTLRDAVAAANAAASDDVINFDASLTTITLINTEIAIANNGSLTINGLGANVFTIDGGAGTNRIFYISPNAVVTITDVKLTGGKGTGRNVSDQNQTLTSSGGAILADQQSTLTLDHVHVTGNTATGSGGGVYYFAQAGIIRNSTFSNNSTGQNGGGFFKIYYGITIVNSTFSGNSAGYRGGGFATNASTGATLRSITVTQNTAQDGGGISNGGSTDLGNSIVARNTSGNGDPDILGATGLTTSGYNLIGNNTGVENVFSTGNSTHDIVGTSTSPINPGLDPTLTTANGSTTPTHALLYGSPALDKGDSFGLTANQRLTTDQRDLLRPVIVYPSNSRPGDGADIGAFEAQTAPAPPTAASVSVSGRVMTTWGRGIRNVRISLTDRNGNVQITVSNAFGYYHFANVEVGETYILNVSSKRYIFDNPTQVISLTEDLAEVNFTASTRRKLFNGINP